MGKARYLVTRRRMVVESQVVEAHEASDALNGARLNPRDYERVAGQGDEDYTYEVKRLES